MTLAIIIGAVVFIFGVWLFLALAKRAVRLAVRLALAAVVFLALLCGALAWWWYGLGTTTAPANRPATRRANNR
ncbi:MAG TPA: hypothetical protein VGB17_12995 [Pyrinomonadaceae bacterium]|jgi:hypothetical protein